MEVELLDVERQSDGCVLSFWRIVEDIDKSDLDKMMEMALDAVGDDGNASYGFKISPNYMIKRGNSVPILVMIITPDSICGRINIPDTGLDADGARTLKAMNQSSRRC